MDKDKLSDRERAFLAEARREALARAEPPAATPHIRTTPSAAERLAQLMEEERARTLQRKKKMRRYGLTFAGAVLALFTLWLLRATRTRR